MLCARTKVYAFVKRTNSNSLRYAQTAPVYFYRYNTCGRLCYITQYSVLKYCNDVYDLSFNSSARTTEPDKMPYDLKKFIYEFFNSLNVYVNILCIGGRRMNKKKKKIPNGFIFYINRIDKPIYIFISIIGEVKIN